MNIENLKCIVGEAEAGKPAIIRLFSSINEDSAKWFNDEFLWLQNYVKPSKIIVMINSEGGRVIDGMSIFSVISACPIEVDCIIEGIAASMASVIWAAGDNRFMHDYSLLMIHNPFSTCSKCKNEDESIKQAVDAFRSQLETIYIKRFGLSKEKVTAIMNGEGDADGTFFNAKEAVKAGFIQPENIIKTSKKVRDAVQNRIEGLDDMTSIRDIMTEISAEVDKNKLLEAVNTIHNRKENLQIQDNKKMENNENLNFDAISAQLGLAKDTKTAAIEARIAELINAEDTLKDVQSELTDTTIKLKGKEAELANVNNELAEVKASLQAYKDAELAAREAEIESVVSDAIAAGKIDASAKEAWVTMAKSNFETVKSTLDSIQARDVITEVIASNPENVAKIDETVNEIRTKAEARFGKITFEKF